MIYLQLLLGFLKVGCFSFGGAYGAIPLIREVVLQYNWMSEEYFSHIIAIAESTPGPIMVNVATYVGSAKAGLLGALLSTIAVVLPSFILIILIMNLLKGLLKNSYFQAILKGMKPCIAGIIIATGIIMLKNQILPNHSIDIQIMIIAVLLYSLRIFLQKRYQKKISPIQLILTGALLGVICNIKIF